MNIKYFHKNTMMDNTTGIPEDFIGDVEIIDIVLTCTVSTLSVIGAVVIFYAHYLRYKDNKPVDEPRQLLIFLTIADLLNALGQLTGVMRYLTSEDITARNALACHRLEEFGCIAQSFITTLFSMSSFFWTTFIAFHLFWTYEDPVYQQTNRKRTIFYHFASWGIPISITIAAVSQNVLGSDLSVGSGAWCWISACLSQRERTIWMTISGKGWEILMYFTCCAFYLLIKWRKIQKRRRKQKVNSGLRLSIRQSNVQEESNQTPHEDIRFLLLWLIEVGLRIFGTVRYLMAAVRRHTSMTFKHYDDSVDNILLHFQSFGDSAQALCSCLLFCILDKETRKLFKTGYVNRSESKPILQRQDTQC